MKATIALCPGDGIGPEVIGEARLVLEDVAQRFHHDFTFEELAIGGCAIDQTGSPLPPSTLAGCERADAVLLGAVGGPKWDAPDAKVRPEAGLLGLRRALKLWANLRPIQVMTDLLGCSPVRPELIMGVDILVVRELTGGLYFGEPRGRTRTADGERAVDTLVYTDEEIRRVVRLAFRLARHRGSRVCSVDKANVLESSRLWRQIAIEVASDYPDVRLEHQLVDSAAMRLISAPRSFDVVVTENMFGDILTDEAAVLAGSLGLLPSASLGDGKKGLYEPIHGSAPDIAGRGVANPIGAILSAALLLRHSLGLLAEARTIEVAVEQAIIGGARTADIRTSNRAAFSTSQMGERIRACLDEDAGAQMMRAF